MVVVLRRRHALLALAGPAWGAATAPLAVGEPLPAVTMRGLNGPDRPLNAWLGRRLLVNVWASWCGPCRAEAASLERFAWSEAGRPYTVIGVSTDDERALAQRWLRQSNATLSHFIDQRLQLEQLLGAQRIPTTVLADERGRVVGRIVGAREWDQPESLRLIGRLYGGR